MPTQKTTMKNIMEEFNKEFPNARIVYPQDLNINLEILETARNIEIPRLRQFLAASIREAFDSVKPEIDNGKLSELKTWNACLNQLNKNIDNFLNEKKLCSAENCDCPENCECKGGYWKCHNHD